MPRTKTVIEVPIQQTRCWNCAFLEKKIYENSGGRLIEAYRCPRNMHLPNMLPPEFAVKCEVYKPKGDLVRK